MIILKIILSIWVLAFATMVAEDNAPCNNSPRKAFLFLSAMLFGVEALLFLWAKILY